MSTPGGMDKFHVWTVKEEMSAKEEIKKEDAASVLLNKSFFLQFSASKR